jgi:hypothetical protein
MDLIQILPSPAYMSGSSELNRKSALPADNFPVKVDAGGTEKRRKNHVSHQRVTW